MRKVHSTLLKPLWELKSKLMITGFLLYINFSQFLPGNSNPCANLNQNGFSLTFHPTVSLIFTPDISIITIYTQNNA